MWFNWLKFRENNIGLRALACWATHQQRIENVAFVEGWKGDNRFRVNIKKNKRIDSIKIIKPTENVIKCDMLSSFSQG